MKHLNDLIKSLDLRIEAMRTEITTEIINLFKSTGFSTLYLTVDEDNLVYVVWFDNEGCGYDCVVKSVSIDGENDIELEIYHSSFDSLISVSSKDGDIACKNIHWLSDILSSMVYTITEKQQNNGN